MRDIRFRGKRIDNGEWVYGFAATNAIGNSTIQLDEWIDGSPMNFEVDPKTIGQFTTIFYPLIGGYTKIDMENFEITSNIHEANNE